MPTEQEYIARIKELESELRKTKKQKRYGLMWENKPEDVVEQCKRELPVITEVKKRRVSTSEDSQTHILIEGDNYHALSVLAYTHEKKIDVIYIDPPYNTGATDWKYNNDYVDSNDTFRHSKFISFLYKRILLAKSLLSDDGFIICAIDEYEVHNVRHLLDDIFGEENKL